MKNVRSILAAAVMACGLSVAAYASPNDGTTPPADRPIDPTVHDATIRDSAREMTSTMSNLNKEDTENIRKTVATATQAALTKGGFDDFVERLSDADRKRIGDYAEQKFDDLDGRIAQFQKDWQAKYNQEFHFENKTAEVLGDSFARMSYGDIPGEARLAGERMGEKMPNKMGDPGIPGTDRPTGDRPAGDRPDNDRLSNDRAANAAGNMTKDRAAIIIPSSHGAPPVAVSVMRQAGDAWRIDLPDNVDGQKLHDALLKHLTMVDEDKANWPADVNDAYRAVTHHVLAATLDAAGQLPDAMDKTMDKTMPGNAK